jgi:hypothetical protein
MPEVWAGFRNIDEEIDLEEINRRLGADALVEDDH